MAGLAAAASVDYLVGPEFILAILYLMPSLYAAWFLGRKSGLWIATMSWLLAFHNAAVFTGVFARELQNAPADIILNGITAWIFFLLTAWLMSSLHDKQAELQHLVDIDLVTGAATARRFYDLLRNEIYRLSRYQHPLTVAYLDIDNFKRINDTFGHAVGDAVLKAVVQQIKAGIRASDCVARLGGDEFAILLPETPSEAARPLFAKMRADLDKRMREANWPVGFSIGVMTCMQATSVEDVLRQADALMYQAKQSGKNATFFDAR